MEDMNRKGIFIPQEIIDMKELNANEMLILSVYWYYTVHGSEHKCFLTNEEISEMTHTSIATVKRAKKRFYEAGLIDRNGGLIVRYMGRNEPAGRSFCTPKEVQNELHNKETNKEEISTYSYEYLQPKCEDDDFCSPVDDCDALKKQILLDMKNGAFETEIQVRQRIHITPRLWGWEEFFIERFHDYQKWKKFQPSISEDENI